jgi:hypothetical protein
MRLNENLFQRSTATRHHPSTDRKSDRLTWTRTAPMGFTGWSQRDTLTTGHGHCCDNRRQHTVEVERIVRSLAARGYKLHAFGAKVLGLGRYADAIASSDSASWSLRGRHVPGCTSTHRSESNCLRFALDWHTRLLATLSPSAPMEDQPAVAQSELPSSAAVSDLDARRRTRLAGATNREPQARLEHRTEIAPRRAA